MKHIIYKDWDSFEEAKEMLEDDWEYDTPITDKDVWQYMTDIDESNWRVATDGFKEVFNGSGRIFILTGYAGTWCGDAAGGYVIYDFKDLQKAWNSNYIDFLEIYEDGYGKLHIEATHHDGTNHWQVRELTEKGKAYLERNDWMPDEKLHAKLSRCPYSKNIHLIGEVWRH